MPTAFSQAFAALTKVSSSAYESLKERILPSPGKRKRDKEVEPSHGSDRSKRRMKVSTYLHTYEAPTEHLFLGGVQKAT